jgi:CheY-like chemotaxis protein
MSSMKRRLDLMGIHVVVIDDDDDARAIMKIVLEAHGALVMVAPSARDGLAALGQIAPDVLLVDLTMPTEDGYWFIDQLKAQPREGGRTAPPAIAVSGYSEGHRARAIRAGFDAFVPKPVDVELLCETIQRLANRKA